MNSQVNITHAAFKPCSSGGGERGAGNGTTLRAGQFTQAGGLLGFAGHIESGVWIITLDGDPPLDFGLESRSSGSRGQLALQTNSAGHPTKFWAMPCWNTDGGVNQFMRQYCGDSDRVGIYRRDENLVMPVSRISFVVNLTNNTRRTEPSAAT
jgi:hypothetical protein